MLVCVPKNTAALPNTGVVSRDVIVLIPSDGGAKNLDTPLALAVVLADPVLIADSTVEDVPENAVVELNPIPICIVPELDDPLDSGAKLSI